MTMNSRILKKLLINRDHSFGVEVGVFEGDTAKNLLKKLPDLKRLVCIDIWKDNPEFKKHTPYKAGKIYRANWLSVRCKFIEQVYNPFYKRVIPLQMMSKDAACLFLNRPFDFIFIDANHGYKYVKEDILVWWQKLKIGGLMCGDDYVNKPSYGVIQAVNELFKGEHKILGPIWYIERIEGVWLR